MGTHSSPHKNQIMARHNQNQGQEPEEESKGISSWVYYVCIVFIFFALRDCVGCNKSDSGNGKTKTESVQKHTGLYDQGYEMGYAASHGMPMTVDQAYDVWSEKVAGAPDSPTPEFIQGFRDGKEGK